jgi:anti-sigma-K factor RskA
VTDDELREQLALYAVGALTDDERTDLEDVLRTRPDLQAELDELEEAATVLADAVTETPPPTLRASILDLIAATPQEPAATHSPVPAAPIAPIAPVVPIGSGRKRNRFVAFGAAVAAVAAIAVGVLVVTTPWSSSDTDPTAAVLESEDAQTIVMPGSLPGLSIVHSPTADAAVLMADQVPVPDGDRVYELWAIRDGTPERVATFRPDDSGRLSVYAPGLDPASAEQWAITEEPAGGSDAPTTPILNQTA